MKRDEYIVLGLAGLALWFIMKGRGGSVGGSGGAAQASTNHYSTKIAPDYEGWQYFSDGVAIGPDGSYYLNGAKVWQP